MEDHGLNLVVELMTGNKAPNTFEDTVSATELTAEGLVTAVVVW